MPDSSKPLHIDCPVILSDVKAVFSIGELSFEGDLPAAIFHLGLVTHDVSEWSATSQVFAIFHTNAGHVTLNDKSYNSDRNIETGNPYKLLLSALIQQGVHVELCGATARAHNWGNEDLLPNINVNTDAMARTIQLVQEGFIKITE